MTTNIACTRAVCSASYQTEIQVMTLAIAKGLNQSESETKPAPNEKILAKYLKRHFLLSWIVSELFQGIFLKANTD